MTLPESPDDLLRVMSERLAYFQARPTTARGRAALGAMESELAKLSALLGRVRGQTPDAGAPRRDVRRVPAAAALLPEE